MAAKHTPGPWHEHSHRQIGPDAGIVCEVWSALGWGEAAIEEADANVRLIAAAPDLLSAAQAAADLLARQKWRPSDTFNPEAVVLAKLQAAIASATVE